MWQSVALSFLAGSALLVVVLLLLKLLPRVPDAVAPASAAPPPAADAERDRAAAADETAEARLREQWYRQLFNSTNDMVLVHGISKDGTPGLFREVNDLACTKLGYTRSKLLTMTPLDIEDRLPSPTVRGYTLVELATLPDEGVRDRRGILEAQALMRHVMEETRDTYERVYVSRTGKKMPVVVEARRIDALDEPMIMCIAHDVSERRAVQRALVESERRSQDFFAYSPIGVAIYDATRKLVNVNQACLRIFGCPAAAEYARFDPFDNPFIPPTARKRLGEGETVRYEAAVDFDEARRVSQLVSSRTGHANLDVILTNLGVDSEFQPKGYLVQVQDITERRHAEHALQESEKQLRQAQKMQAIGTLAGGIAHDFNNILTPILGYAEMSLYTCKDNEPVQKYLKEVMKAANRAKDLVKQILTFSRQMEPEAKPMRVTPIIKEVVTLIQAAMPKNVEVKRSIKTEHDVIVANPTQIHQILMNLCTNAGHAMRETGGVLEVWLSEFVAGVGRRTEFPTLEPGRYLRITVKDSGTGMDAKVAERIFEPFFTTKERGEGTGMGLAVVHGIVITLKGAIGVETAPGKGSTFHVALPLMDRTEAEEAVVSTDMPEGHECVLCVDDDPDIGNMVARMLQTLGYQPVVSASAEDALSLFKQNPGQFAAVIVDQLMPRMTGTELAGHLRELRPDLGVILCTGHSDTLPSKQLEDLGIREIVLKPILMRPLAEAVRRTLDKTSAPAAAAGNAASA